MHFILGRMQNVFGKNRYFLYVLWVHEFVSYLDMKSL